MSNKQNLDLSNLDLMKLGLFQQSLSLYLADKSLEELLVLKPHFKPLVDEMKLLDNNLNKL